MEDFIFVKAPKKGKTDISEIETDRTRINPHSIKGYHFANRKLMDKYSFPQIDIKEVKNEIVILLDISEIEKKDMNIYLSNRNVEVEAQRHITDDNGINYIKTFYRAIVLPCIIIPESSYAILDSGILEIRAQKA